MSDPINNTDKENLWKYINALHGELSHVKEKLAPFLGLMPFKAKCSDQIIWAKSQEDANDVGLGESVFKHLDEAIK